METEDSGPIEYFEFTPEMESEAESLISQDKTELSSFIYNKFETQASKMWNTFYKHNSTHFYKDRHYISKEFPELSSVSTLLEVGCGVGNAIFPLLEEFPLLQAQVCDFSEQAIKLLVSSEKFDPSRTKAVVCDISNNPVCFENECEAVLMLFVLSAIAPEKHRQAILNASQGLKKGGIFLFRDYAKYDLAQIRLAAKGKKRLKEGFYLKQDGTRVFYFTKDDLLRIFEGFTPVENEYQYRVVKNRKDEKTMYRIWIQAKFVKD